MLNATTANFTMTQPYEFSMPMANGTVTLTQDPATSYPQQLVVSAMDMSGAAPTLRPAWTMSVATFSPRPATGGTGQA